jgi:hypothetical protein
VGYFWAGMCGCRVSCYQRFCFGRLRSGELLFPLSAEYMKRVLVKGIGRHGQRWCKAAKPSLRPCVPSLPPLASVSSSSGTSAKWTIPVYPALESQRYRTIRSLHQLSRRSSIFHVQSDIAAPNPLQHSPLFAIRIRSNPPSPNSSPAS